MLLFLFGTCLIFCSIYIYIPIASKNGACKFDPPFISCRVLKIYVFLMKNNSYCVDIIFYLKMTAMIISVWAHIEVLHFFGNCDRGSGLNFQRVRYRYSCPMGPDHR